MLSRRAALRTLFTLAAAAFTGGALARIVTTPRRAGADADAAPAPFAFDETYRGRRIQGGPLTPRGSAEVLIDGRPLHLMRRADGSYLSAVDHYESCETPLAAARAAVDRLGSARLSPEAAIHGVRTGGGPRGVHA
ncbi:tyrosinase family oxidase copper chaperone [Streptomyces purpureus]|uniref:Tyrosinase co-factor protein n=1 Tax=Streptomyces purpureus TaxID=1951 RepID=A0A918LUS4_9ACTN|nr:tyrosinase family oxidase copper chaperone [Streptomyces purpureus]GGT52806.1 hypothetical protein GCM10014713_53440 [Streptomyces purpureus]